MGKLKAVKIPDLLKLDFGCGKNPREGFTGVDNIDFGQKFIVDLTQPWPWKDASVEEAHASHFIEHLTAQQRVHFVNELYRVLTPGGKCQIIVPYWASGRAYGDMTHQWPPVAEMWFYYLLRAWRLGDDNTPGNAPHCDIKYNPLGYTCDFDAAWGHNLHPLVAQRNQEYQQHAVQFYKEAAQDLIATLTKR